MPSNKRKNDSSRADAPPAKRDKTTEIVDVTKENKENMSAVKSEGSVYPPLSPSQEIAPWSATAQNYNPRTGLPGLSWFANGPLPSKTVPAMSDADAKQQRKARRDKKVKRIHASIPASDDMVFGVVSDIEIGGCFALHKTLHGALQSAVTYLDDYGMIDLLTDDELDDSDEGQEADEDAVEVARKVKVLLNVAQLHSVSERPRLTIKTEDEEGSVIVVDIKQMKVGA